LLESPTMMKNICDSTVSILLSKDGKAIKCDVTPDVLERTDTLILKNPKVIDGFGDKTVSKVCHFCKKDALVLVAEICEIEFISQDNKIKTLTVSGYDSYNLQDKIHSLDEDSCLCPK